MSHHSYWKCDECKRRIPEADLLPEVRGPGGHWEAKRPRHVALLSSLYFDLCKDCHDKVKDALPECVKLLKQRQKEAS